MVYTGPSTGCRACRERHTGCDRERPQCRRCVLRGRVCPGYRDVRGVVFKDVNQGIVEEQTRWAERAAMKIPISRLPLPTNSQAFFYQDVVTHFSRQSGRLDSCAILQGFLSDHGGRTEKAWIYVSAPGGLLKQTETACLEQGRMANCVRSGKGITALEWHVASFEV